MSPDASATGSQRDNKALGRCAIARGPLLGRGWARVLPQPLVKHRSVRGTRGGWACGRPVAWRVHTTESDARTARGIKEPGAARAEEASAGVRSVDAARKAHA